MLEGHLTKRPRAVGTNAGARFSALLALAREHVALVVLLGIAALVRILALVAIYPGIWFPDTNDYVKTATTGTVSIVRVSGYSLVVAPFVRVGGAAALIVLQHLIGLALVVLVYAFLLRRGVPRLLALVAVVPLALDAYLIALEHMIMSETVFHLTVLGALFAILWKERVSVLGAAASGLLLGYAGTVRSVALPFVALFVVYLVVRRVGVYPVVALALTWALVVGGYLLIFKVEHGEFAFTRYSGRFLYTQVAPFANCAKVGGIPANERFLCPNPHHRLTPNGYIWSRRSPAYGLPSSKDDLVHDFSMRVIKAEPYAYARSVAGDFFHYFEPGYRQRLVDVDRARWEFPANPHRWGIPGYRGPIRRGDGARFQPGPYIDAVVGKPSVSTRASRLMHDYQRLFWTSGQILSLCVLVVLAALVWRPRRWFRPRLDAALLTVCALTAMLVAAALSVFDYRYGLVAVVLLPPAAALAGSAMLAARRDAEPATSA